MEQSSSGESEGQFPCYGMAYCVKDHPCWNTGLLPAASGGAWPWGSERIKGSFAHTDHGGIPAAGGESFQLSFPTPQQGMGTEDRAHVPLPAGAAPGSKCGDGFPSRPPPPPGI